MNQRSVGGFDLTLVSPSKCTYSSLPEAHTDFKAVQAAAFGRPVAVSRTDKMLETTETLTTKNTNDKEHSRIK